MASVMEIKTMGYVMCAFVCGVLVRPVLASLMMWYHLRQVLAIDMHTRARRQEEAGGKL